MSKLTAVDVKTFIPAKDFSISKEFYCAIGWKLNWENEGLAELELADNRFLLQDFYVKEWAENFMIHITVLDARLWYDHISGILKDTPFPGARVRIPKREPYGALVTFVWDPAGVLLHFAQYDS